MISGCPASSCVSVCGGTSPTATENVLNGASSYRGAGGACASFVCGRVTSSSTTASRNVAGTLEENFTSFSPDNDQESVHGDYLAYCTRS